MGHTVKILSPSGNPNPRKGTQDPSGCCARAWGCVLDCKGDTQQSTRNQNDTWQKSGSGSGDGRGGGQRWRGVQIKGVGALILLAS
eukprot:15149109-Ditylum_brightwellii.AAC.1